MEILRLPRSYTIHLKIQHGSLGDYERSIIRAAWSSDSRILAVSDLQGHLDSWVLEGYEDLTQKSNHVVNGHDLMTESASNKDDEESDENPDEEAHPLVIFGQHWIRNPRAASLPRLPTFPLVMSFRPKRPAASATLTNGSTTVHPTRHNPHPHSHDLPIGEDRLFVLTSLHRVYEYQIFAGRLSDWSRRNPSSALPEEFRAVRDRAMDCVWDVSGGHERVWVYGSSFLWMFDLARDLPAAKPVIPETESNSNGDSQQISKSSRKRKRKHMQEENQSLMQGTTGAGSKVPERELKTGIGSKMHKSVGLEQGEGQWISLQTPRTEASVEDDDRNDDDGVDDATGTLSALVRLRRTGSDRVHLRGDVGEGDRNSDEQRTSNGDVAADRTEGKRLPYWHTFKYRPMLGIVALGDPCSAEDDSLTSSEDVREPRSGIEVALVERPSWDLDLPPRYHGDQEWDE